MWLHIRRCKTTAANFTCSGLVFSGSQMKRRIKRTVRTVGHRSNNNNAYDRSEINTLNPLASMVFGQGTRVVFKATYVLVSVPAKRFASLDFRLLTVYVIRRPDVYCSDCSCSTMRTGRPVLREISYGIT